MGAQVADAGFGVYLHWPFCKSKCPYCDFNSHVREKVDQERLRAALLADLEHAAARSGPRRVTSVFFGGGTPSLMPAETVAAAPDKIADIGRAQVRTPVTNSHSLCCLLLEKNSLPYVY